MNSTALYVVGDLLSKSINFLLIPLYTGYLSTTEYGKLAVANSIFSLITIIWGLGFAGVITRYFFDIKFKERKEELLGTSFVFLLLFSGIGTLFIDYIGMKGYFDDVLDFSYQPIVRLIVFSSFFSVFSIIPQVIFRVHNQPIKFSLYNSLYFLLVLSFTYISIEILHMGVVGAATSLFAANLICGFLYLIVSFNYIRLSFSWLVIKNILVLALPLLPHLVSHWMLSLSDRLILSNIVSLDKVGIYTLGYQIGSLVFILAIGINNAWIPLFYENVADKGKHGLISNLSSLAMTGTSLLVVFLIFCLPLISLILNRSYQGFANIVPWVAIGGMFQLAYYFFVNTLLYLKKVTFIPLFTIFCSLINIVLNIIFVPLYGITAAAINTTIAYALLALLNGWACCKSFPKLFNIWNWCLNLLCVVIYILLASLIEPLSGILEAITKFIFYCSMFILMSVLNLIDKKLLLHLLLGIRRRFSWKTK